MDVLALKTGQSWTGLLAHEGNCYAAAASAGSGYREFKTVNGDGETVIAFVVAPCGALSANGAKARSELMQHVARPDSGMVPLLSPPNVAELLLLS